LTYGDIFRQTEEEYSAATTLTAPTTEMLFRHFEDAEGMRAPLAFDADDPKSGKRIIMAHPAYDQTIKASHLFNLLDARGVISVTERQAYIGRVRALAKKCADAFRQTEAGRGRGGRVNGRIAAGVIVGTAILAGIVMYWLQVYAFYEEVAFEPGNEIRLMPVAGDVPEAILAENVTGIDADSSPLRFRACFTTPLSQAMLTETYRLYDTPEPLIAPVVVRLLRRPGRSARRWRRARRWPSCRNRTSTPASTGSSRSFPMAGPLPGTRSNLRRGLLRKRDLPADCPPAPKGKN
jgi:hypothetical protein